MTDKVVVGQKILVVSGRKDDHKQEITLGKVARRWAETEENDWKIDLRDGWVNGWNGRAIGRWYLSEEDYQAASERERVKQATIQAWYAFRNKVGGTWSMPDGLTLERIVAATESLFGTKENA